MSYFNHVITLLAVSVLMMGGHVVHAEMHDEDFQRALVNLEIYPETMKAEYSECVEKLKDFAGKYKGGEFGATSQQIDDRLLLATRLVDGINEKMSSDTVNSLYEASRMLDDLKLFIQYFTKKQALMQKQADPDQEITLSIKDFGAIGDGVHDDGPAFAEAFAAAEKYAPKSVTIMVPEGVYFLKQGRCVKPDNQNWKAHLVFNGLKNITVVGVEDKTTLLLDDWFAMGVVLYKCENVHLKNLTFRLKLPPFHQGDILEVYPKEQAVLWRGDAGFPYPDHPLGTPDACCQSYDPQTGWLIPEASHFFYEGKYNKVGDGDGLYKIYFRDFKAGIRPGLKLIMPARDGSFGTSYVAESTFCTYENITVLNSRAGAFTDVESFASAYIHCRVIPDRANGAFLSTDADGVHCQNDYFGVYVENCEFRNLGDDSFNTYSKGYLIDGTCQNGFFASNGGIVFAEGARISIVSSQTGNVEAVRVSQGLKVGDCMGQQWAMTGLGAPLPSSVVTRENMKKRESEHEMSEARAGFGTVTLPNVAFEHGRSGVGTVIRDSVFGGNRNCAIVVQTSSALVTENKIENVNATGIHVASLIYPWQEGLFPFNVIVSHNDIRHVGTGIITSIRVEDDESSTNACPLFDITIEENNVEQVNKQYLLRNLAK